ncbi:peptide chain release factor N(5)-glutamine methyltransferase [Aestuariibacter salexigens]|uniref:peptide chain release factor N(5)-glutamine methyltransferase n=1 Tax=Aestuariibacter salexigens TaxID=226010 RepID=UPI0004296883|nr:peptide chain release factor N(5)-glutamine methyltransferase [Aestuariibacter salexigens]
MNDTSRRIDTLLNWAQQQLGDLDSPADSRYLLSHVINRPLAYLMTWNDKLVDDEQAKLFKALIEKRRTGWPVAYLTGHREFWSLELDVNPSTLIPRPDTEILVEAALSLPLADHAHILDLGTGSGAIALALASEKPTWQVDAVDVSAEAVALAMGNANKHHIDNVTIWQSDWFSDVTNTYQMIVSNPPYVEQNSARLSQGDVRFEPDSALVSGEDGLDDIKHIINACENYLVSGGWLVLEHGFEQGEAIRSLLNQNQFSNVKTVKDLAGLDRVTLGQYVQQSE